MNVKDINIFYKSIIQVCKIKSIKLPEINNFIDPEELPNISLCMPTYNRKKFMKLVEMNYNNTTYPKEKSNLLFWMMEQIKVEDEIPKVIILNIIIIKKKKQ